MTILLGKGAAPVAPFPAVRESGVALPFSPFNQVLPTIREVLVVGVQESQCWFIVSRRPACYEWRDAV